MPAPRTIQGAGGRVGRNEAGHDLHVTGERDVNAAG